MRFYFRGVRSQTLLGYEPKIEESTGITCLTAESALLGALKSVGAKKLAIGTPQGTDRDVYVECIFGKAGFEVCGIRHLEIEGLGLTEVNRPGPERAYQLGRDTDLPDADALCILATDFRTIEAIEPLERDVGKPVITNNQAIFWACLRRAGLQAAVGGYGRLLRDS